MKLLACALALGWASAVAAADKPHYAVSKEGVLVVSELPRVLTAPEVRPHLTTGLTTSFVLAVSASRTGATKIRGAARIDIRWEPWDEVFLTTVIGIDGRPRRETVASFERLDRWWHAQDLPAARGLSRGPWDVKVELSVVPFSQAEELDAQRWFSTTVGGDEGTRSANEGASRLDSVVDLLMATSIHRQSIVRYAWRAEPLARAQPGPGR
jgi:hypothetical protein